jgi:hypothetical protein
MCQKRPRNRPSKEQKRPTDTRIPARTCVKRMCQKRPSKEQRRPTDTRIPADCHVLVEEDDEDCLRGEHISKRRRREHINKRKMTKIACVDHTNVRRDLLYGQKRPIMC